MKVDDSIEFTGDGLRLLLQLHDLKISQYAEQIDVSRQTIHNILRKQDVPLPKIYQLATSALLT